MTGHRVPRTTDQAKALLERHAELEGQINHIEGVRNRLISQANANADASAERVLAELAEIRAKLEPWWDKASAELTGGKRKSIELGGCMIGTRVGKDSLGMADDLAPVIKSLQRRQWAEQLLKTTVTIDKAAVLKSIGGCYDRQLKELGFARIDGVATFFVKRTEQGGTLVGAAA